MHFSAFIYYSLCYCANFILSHSSILLVFIILIIWFFPFLFFIGFSYMHIYTFVYVFIYLRKYLFIYLLICCLRVCLFVVVFCNLLSLFGCSLNYFSIFHLFSLLFIFFFVLFFIYLFFCYQFQLLSYFHFSLLSNKYFLTKGVIEDHRSMIAVNRLIISTVAKVGFRLFPIVAEGVYIYIYTYRWIFSANSENVIHFNPSHQDIQLNPCNSNPQRNSKLFELHEFSNYRSSYYFGQILEKISRGFFFTM